MYKVIAQGQLCYQGVNKPTAIETFKDWQAAGEVVGLYLNDRQIATTDTSVLEDEDEMVTGGIECK